MKTGKFYNFIATGGNKMVNINNIAIIEDMGAGGICVTLNVSKEKGVNISFSCQLPWPDVTGQIKFLDENQTTQ